MAQQEVIGEFEARRVSRMLARLFIGRMRRDEAIGVSGWRDDTWLCVRWELARADRSRVYPVQARIDLKRSGLRVTQARDLLYDFLGQFFDAYLRGGREPFSGPRWEAVDFAGHTLFVCGQELDEAAEQAAEALLEQAARSGSPADGPPEPDPAG